jgi:hypothetical protein
MFYIVFEPILFYFIFTPHGCNHFQITPNLYTILYSPVLSDGFRNVLFTPLPVSFGQHFSIHLDMFCMATISTAIIK